jgi:hypothetical protein
MAISTDIDVVADGTDRIATGSGVGNLGDLQAKALQIAQDIPLPKEQCANQNGLNVVVDAIHGASLEGEGDVATLEVAGTMTAYGCLMGVGAPVATTQVAISAPFRIEVASPTDVGLVLAGPVELVAAGLPPDASALLNDQATQALTTALAQARMQGSLVGLPGLAIDVSDAAFFTEGETLMLRIAGTSRMDEATFDQLLTDLGATAPAGL